MATIDATHGNGLTVAVVGAECSGKTTLARELAEHFDAPCVPEYARAYLQGPTYGPDDVLAIARGQHESELAEMGPLVIADTDLVVIKIWWQVRFGGANEFVDSTLRRAIAGPRGRAYLLAKPDIPWEPDPLRENPHDRPALHALYRGLLQSLGTDFVEIGGSREVRRARAIAVVERWLSR